MPFNRSIQMKLVKTPKTSVSDETPEVPAVVDIAYFMREFTEVVAPKVIIGVGVYVAVDTLRQVLVKLTPTN